MPHLYDLPEDILLLILHELQNPLCRISDRNNPITEHLPKFALASKPLLHLTQKLLYSAFWSFKEQDTRKIRAFLCTLIANPSLALHVQYLILPVWRAWDRESDEWDDGTGTKPYEEDRKYTPARKSRDKKLFHKAIRELALTDKKSWRKAVTKDCDEVYVALLILLCPNVTHLNMWAPCNPVFIDKVLDHATIVRPVGSILPSLQNLKEVYFACRGNMSQIDFDHIVALFRLPAIQDLSMCDVSSRNAPLFLPPNFTVKHLRMQNMDVDTGILKTIISGLKVLETFHYEHRGFAYSDMPGHVMQLNDLGRALNSVATLQEVELIVHELDSGVLGSLRECSRLRRLDTSLYHLLGSVEAGDTARLVDILPSSLEELKIGMIRVESAPSEKYSNMISQVRELVDESSAGYPALRKIRLSRHSVVIQPETACRTVMVDLINACRRQNIALTDPIDDTEYTLT